MKQYRHANWVQFRNEVIKLHHGCCARCLRSAGLDDVVLQVHHKRYIRGRLPWEYETTDCEALCKGCHAAEHGHVMPRHGWNWVGVDDLGDLAGNCELCGTEIRYIYAIQHPAWSTMAVGTDCCDKLTQTREASEHHEKYIKVIDARKRFVASKRWEVRADGAYYIKQKGIHVEIRQYDNEFGISMNLIAGKQRFESLLDAKIKAFDSIRSGEAQEFLERRRHTRAPSPIELSRIRAWLASGKL